MGEQKNLIVGMDLCETYTQLSVYNKKTGEPETINLPIVTALGITNNKKEWLFGQEAYEYEEKQEGIVINKLLTKLRENQEVDIFSVKFTPVVLMEKYLRKCLQILKKYYPTESILMICITLKNNNELVREGILTALENLGVGPDRVILQNHEKSYGYFALNQPKELWMNDIGLFEFDEEGLKYYQITIDRKSAPMLGAIKCKDYKEELSLEQMIEVKEKEEKERLNHFFLNIAKNTLYRQYVTTLYVTGKGFEGNWCDGALKELCGGRRVFKGQNLYSKGACYAALKQVDGKKDDFLLIDDEMITTDITVAGLANGKLTDILLIKGAQPWYYAKNRLEFILDDCSNIILYLKDCMKYQVREETICLSDIPTRPNKTTRVELQIKFLNKETIQVIITDKGFGGLYPTSNKIWTKEIII